MLPKINRIVTDKDIKATYNSKFKVRSDLFSLITRRNNFQTNFKVLIIVSKKISKKAHDRNKIKHRISAIIQELILESRPNKEFSIIVLAQSKDILTTRYSDLKVKIESSLSRNLFYRQPMPR
jgi:ribonuclease P protein component